MSYERAKGERGFSKKREKLYSQKSGVLSIEEESFGGSVFGNFIPKSNKSYSSLVMNMQNEGTSLCTRNKTEKLNFTKTLEAPVMLTNFLHACRAENLGVLQGDVLISDIYSDSGEYDGALLECVFHDPEEPLYDPYLGMDPLISFSSKFAVDNYILRIFSEEGLFPSVTVSRSNIQTIYNGKPEVKTNSSGKKYADAEFSVSNNTSDYNILFSFEKPSEDIYNASFKFRIMLLSKTEISAAGVENSKINDVDFSSEKGSVNVAVTIPDGENCSECFYDGKYVFTRGKNLVVFDTDKEITEVKCSDIPNLKSKTIHIEDRFLTLFENGELYTFSDDVSNKEIWKSGIYIPTLYSVTNGTNGKATAVEQMNILTEYFYIRLGSSSIGTYELPKNLFVDGDYIKAYDPKTNKELENSNVNLSVEPYSDGGGKIQTNAQMLGLLVRLRLKKDETGFFTDFDTVERYRKIFFSSFGNTPFPSAISGEDNLICFGGDNEKDIGVFRINEKMYIKPCDALIVENNEKVTSVVKYTDEYLVFSPHYIRKLMLSENGGEENRFSYSFENFKYDVGCDSPKSVALADDRIIYLNSVMGIFCIDRFGFSQRDMSRKVSLNIEPGEYGLFSHSDTELQNAEAVFCDNKYFLRVGDDFYVWDFMYSAPKLSGGTEESEREMKWFLFSDMECKNIFGKIGKTFFFEDKSGGISCYNSGISLLSEVETVYKSREYSFSDFDGALVVKLSVFADINDKCTVKFFFDGDISPCEYGIFKNGSAVYALKPEKKRCGKFSFSVSSNSAFRLCGYKIEYII